MTEGAVAAVKPYQLEWEEACAQKLYKPLGMTSTSSRYADFIARQNKALGHVLVTGSGCKSSNAIRTPNHPPAA
jgi:hypothetical protein